MMPSSRSTRTIIPDLQSAPSLYHIVASFSFIIRPSQVESLNPFESGFMRKNLQPSCALIYISRSLS